MSRMHNPAHPGEGFKQGDNEALFMSEKSFVILEFG